MRTQTSGPSMKRARPGAVRIAAIGVAALLGFAGCGEATGRDGTGINATRQQISAFVRASAPSVYWLGTAFQGHPVEQASRLPEGLQVAYGPRTCAGISGCTWALTVTTSDDRSWTDDRPGGACVQDVESVVVLACPGTGFAEAFPGGQKVTVEGVDVPASQLVAALQRPGPGATAVAPTTAFRCAELREWPDDAVTRLPPSVRCR